MDDAFANRLRRIIVDHRRQVTVDARNVPAMYTEHDDKRPQQSNLVADVLSEGVNGVRGRIAMNHQLNDCYGTRWWRAAGGCS